MSLRQSQASSPGSAAVNANSMEIILEVAAIVRMIANISVGIVGVYIWYILRERSPHMAWVMLGVAGYDVTSAILSMGTAFGVLERGGLVTLTYFGANMLQVIPIAIWLVYLFRKQS